MKKDGRVFSASELGQYMFCSVSWYLKRQGHQSASTKKKSHGMMVHDEIGKKMYRSQWLIRVSYLLICCGIVLFLFVLLTHVFNIIGW